MADPRFARWYAALTPVFRASVAALLGYLSATTPADLGPGAARIEGSRHYPKMWELRRSTRQSDREIILRILVAIHDEDTAVVLVGGDKAGPLGGVVRGGHPDRRRLLRRVPAEAAMSDDITPGTGDEWKDWWEVAAEDLADPAFVALVEEVEADQREWSREYRVTLAAVRKALHLTQGEVGERIGATQPEVSRLERRDDVLVSTLRAFVGALGADLELVARFADGHVVRIDLSDVA